MTLYSEKVTFQNNKMIWSVVSTVVWAVGALPLTLIALIYFRYSIY